jgi:DNA-binding transcriptional LysR family regulator
MRLELNLVEIFCCVVDEGSFSKAGEKLCLTQPTISGHIKNLENFVGTPLLDRLPRKIVLTRAGKLLYKYGQSILCEKKSAIRELEQLLNCEQGEIVLSGSSIPSEYLLPPIVASFRKKFPNIKIEILISDSRGSITDVLSGKAELGFVGAIFDEDEIEYRYFGSDELALVVPVNEEWGDVESIKVNDLITKPFLARESGSGTRRAFESILGYSLDRFNLAGCFGSMGAIREALKANIGVSVVSVLSVSAELASGLLKTVKIDDIGSMKREFYVITNRKLSLSPIANAFLECAVPDMNMVSDALTAGTGKHNGIVRTV